MPVQPLSFYCSSSSKPVPRPMMITDSIARIRKVAQLAPNWSQNQVPAADRTLLMTSFRHYRGGAAPRNWQTE